MSKYFTRPEDSSTFVTPRNPRLDTITILATPSRISGHYFFGRHSAIILARTITRVDTANFASQKDVPLNKMAEIAGVIA